MSVPRMPKPGERFDFKIVDFRERRLGGIRPGATRTTAPGKVCTDPHTEPSAGLGNTA